jgi:hypothetical protein
MPERLDLTRVKSVLERQTDVPVDRVAVQESSAQGAPHWLL